MGPSSFLLLFSSIQDLQPRDIISDPTGSGTENPVLPFQLQRSHNSQWPGGRSVRLGDRQLPPGELHQGASFCLRHQAESQEMKNTLICRIIFTAAETRGVVSDELLARKFCIQSFLVSSSRTLPQHTAGPTLLYVDSVRWWLVVIPGTMPHKKTRVAASGL